MPSWWTPAVGVDRGSLGALDRPGSVVNRQSEKRGARSPGIASCAIVKSRLTSVGRIIQVTVMTGVLDDIENCATSAIYPVYWREFWKRVDEYDGVVRFNVRGRSNPSRGWIPLVRTGIRGIFFSAVTSVDKGKIEADFTLENEGLSREKFELLKTHQDDIERVVWPSAMLETERDKQEQ